MVLKTTETMQNYKYISVLTIAGSDSGGGAGIQADLKTFSALGCYGTSAITAVTAQNTLGVTVIHPVPPEVIAAQIVAVMADIKPSAIKIGLLPNAEAVLAVTTALKRYEDVPIIVDPVMIASTGGSLATAGTLDALRDTLFPIAELITPNIPETTAFTGSIITDIQSMRQAMPFLLKYNSFAVLIKGGHLPGTDICHYYADKNGNQKEIHSSFIETNNTHGTGCTLSAAIAVYIARGEKLHDAILLAEKFVGRALAEGKNVKTGQGSGPLNHFFKPRKLARIES
jgi:hydroxymethylpyrimidine/phosphomethylpyrimidine kinase